MTRPGVRFTMESSHRQARLRRGLRPPGSLSKAEDRNVPELTPAQQLQEFADEIFEVTKSAWTAQSQAKTKGHVEVTETEFLALDILARAGRSLHVGEIQREIGILPAQMSRVIRSLENKGDKPLVKCQINAEDKRKIDVELTPAGREAHQTYRQWKLGSIQKMLLTLSETDRSELVRILRLIRSEASKSLQNK